METEIDGPAGESVLIETADGAADAYLCRPPGEVRRPGVLFVVDAFGLRPQIERMCDRIAAEGYAVLAPNIFYRAGRAPVASLEGLDDPARRGEVLERVRPLMAGLTPERCVSDADAFFDFLGRIAPGRAAITGYCMGGRIGWHLAAARPDRVAALGAFHTGGLVSDSADSPHLLAGEVTADLFFGHADSDPSMTSRDIATLERTLDETGASYRSELFKGAMHGYTMADTPAYDEAAAERHYRELFSLLNGVGR